MIAAIVLAAGQSRRMGHNKMLLELDTPEDYDQILKPQ
jgi:CTP:molybdopterin cytidylyltransferase MocA